MANEAARPVEIPLQCLYTGCQNEGHLLWYPGAPGSGSVTPVGGWVFYALGYPSTRRNLGVCPDHQHVALAGEPALDVQVRPEAHGVYYEIRQHGVVLGKATFPTNTLQLQFAPGGVSDALRAAGRRVAAAYGFLPDDASS